MRTGSADGALALCSVVGTMATIAVHLSSRLVTLETPAASFAAGALVDGAAHVGAPLLFMALGAAALAEERSYRGAWWYVAIATAGWSLLSIAWSLGSGERTGWTWIPPALAMGVSFHLWLPYALLATGVALPLLARVWRGSGAGRRVAITAIALILAMLDAGWDARRGHAPAWPHLALHHLPYVFVGALVAERGGRIARRWWLAAYLAGTALAVVSVGPVLRATGGYYAFDHLSPAVVLASVGAFGALYRSGVRSTRTLALLAAAAVHAYLVQIVVMQALGWAGWGASPAALALALPALIASAFAIGLGVALAEAGVRRLARG